MKGLTASQRLSNEVHSFSVFLLLWLPKFQNVLVPFIQRQSKSIKSSHIPALSNPNEQCVLVRHIQKLRKYLKVAIYFFIQKGVAADDSSMNLEDDVVLVTFKPGTKGANSWIFVIRSLYLQFSKFNIICCLLSYCFIITFA